jgi:Asp-tRNA(Asn)/Glu-tRNA(Gln) amidotransferase C subunit
VTAPEERALLADYLEACKRLAETFDEIIVLVGQVFPVTVDTVDSFASRDRIHVLAFLKTYEQFEDTLQRTLKTIIQIMEQGKVERLTGVDIANRSASLGAIADERRWSDAVRTRNKLTHEYPTRPDKRVSQLNDAWGHRETLRETSQSVGQFVANEGLLRDD